LVVVERSKRSQCELRERTVASYLQDAGDNCERSTGVDDEVRAAICAAGRWKAHVSRYAVKIALKIEG
jgi:hypothetical protein